MKKIIYLPILLFFILSNVTYSQDSNFYIGVSAGYASPGGTSMVGLNRSWFCTPWLQVY